MLIETKILIVDRKEVELGLDVEDQWADCVFDLNKVAFMRADENEEETAICFGIHEDEFIINMNYKMLSELWKKENNKRFDNNVSIT